MCAAGDVIGIEDGQFYTRLNKIQYRIIIANMAKRSTTRRRRKGDKRDRTRARLIDAAAEVIGERGWDRTSLEEVARRARMTRGAIYGNFANREELLVAVGQARWKPLAPQHAPRRTFRQHLRAAG